MGKNDHVDRFLVGMLVVLFVIFICGLAMDTATDFGYPALYGLAAGIAFFPSSYLVGAAVHRVVPGVLDGG